jgi:hypothetical protein
MGRKGEEKMKQILILFSDTLTNKGRILTAALTMTISAVAATSYANSFLLTPSQTQLAWQGWNITISHLAFSKTIKQGHGEPLVADSDSAFVYLDVTVKNASHGGQSFVPRNDVKIIIGDDAFDAEDIDANYDYGKNIEPTLAKRRECYFELPKALVKDAFLLRFSSLLTDKIDVPVSIAVSNLTDDDAVRKQNNTELSKLPAPVPEAISVPTPEAYPAPTPEENSIQTYTDNISAEGQLNAAWSRLSVRQRNQLREAERVWIRKKDDIHPITARTEEIRARTRELLSFREN